MKFYLLFIALNVFPNLTFSQKDYIIDVSIDRNNMKINNQKVRDSISLFFYDINCFNIAFREKPKKIKNKQSNTDSFYFVNTGCSVSKSKVKKSFPFEVAFFFNYDPHYIPLNDMKMFNGIFYFNNIKICNSTTLSSLSEHYVIKSNILEFGKVNIEFDGNLPSSKIICVKMDL